MSIISVGYIDLLKINAHEKNTNQNLNDSNDEFSYHPTASANGYHEG